MQNYFLLDFLEQPISSFDVIQYNNIESIQSQNDGCFLALTSWDKSVRIYDPQISYTSYLNEASNDLNIQEQNHRSDDSTFKKSSVNQNYISTGKCISNIKTENIYLNCKFINSSTLLVGGFNNAVETINILESNPKPNKITKHSATVRCISFIDNYSMLISGSWDGEVIISDLRTNNSNCVISKMEVKGKVFCMDHTYNHEWLLIGDSFKNMNIINIKKLSSNKDNSSIEIVPNFMKYQLRSISANKHKDVFATSSIEGRVQITSIENALRGEINNKEIPIDNYAFKCHRTKDNIKMTETIYPVNTVCYHPEFSNVLSTGGSDGTVFLWDTTAKKRLWKTSNFQLVDIQMNPIRTSNESISLVKFHPTLPYLISSSYDIFDQTIKESAEIKNLHEIQPNIIQNPQKSSIIFHSVHNVKPLE